LKKIAAILFFSILLFDWVGYRLVIGLFEKEHSREMQVKLDQASYDESELVLVKTPYPLPYLVNSHDFERWDGEVKINGVLYKYVKRRFINDSIEFLCLPDYNSMKLQTAKEDYFRMTNDPLQSPQNKKSDQHIPPFKQLQNEYCEEIQGFDFGIADIKLLHHSCYIASDSGFYGDTTEQPPDIC
jgi:hypothetical protein